MMRTVLLVLCAAGVAGQIATPPFGGEAFFIRPVIQNHESIAKNFPMTFGVQGFFTTSTRPLPFTQNCGDYFALIDTNGKLIDTTITYPACPNCDSRSPPLSCTMYPVSWTRSLTYTPNTKQVPLSVVFYSKGINKLYKYTPKKLYVKTNIRDQNTISITWEE